MKLIFETGAPGRHLTLLPPCDVPQVTLSQGRTQPLVLPEVSETELTRHYTALSKRVHGVNDGFYPLGSCTMKYNPKINEDMAALPGFTQIHPLQPQETVQGCLEAYALAEELFGEITGMDAMTFQPAAGAHGEFTGLLLIKAYHRSRGELGRNKIIVPDSAHGTNPASAVMGVVRPGDMGFDVIHLNLHKTFSTPHGGGGPGAGAVGCKELLRSFLPGPVVVKGENGYQFAQPEQSIGRMKNFYGNFSVVIKALTYVLTLGQEGIGEAAQNAVLNANYMRKRLEDTFHMAYAGPCMHEFVMSLDDLKEETGVSALDLAKGLLDNGIHPPTMYFPLIVHEVLMVEPTETESRETLDEACDVFLKLWEQAHTQPQSLHDAPVATPVGRLDEVGAARHPVLRYQP